MKRFQLLRYVGPGEVIPAFYGVAWHEWATCRYATLPIPLALPVGVARWIWAGLRTATKNMALDPRTAYLDGFERGFQRAREIPAGRSITAVAGDKCRLVSGADDE